MPPGRHVREIWGAMSTSAADAEGRRYPELQQYLDSTQKVDGFFMLTTSQPIYFMGVLSTSEGPNPKPNTPAPERRPYLDLENFALLDYYYQEAIVKPYDIISQRMGFTKRRLPRKDEVFEDHIRALRRKIRRLKEAKDYLKGKYKEKYPDAIYSDDECKYYHMYHPSNSDNLPIDATDFVGCHAQARLDMQLAQECEQHQQKKIFTLYVPDTRNAPDVN